MASRNMKPSSVQGFDSPNVNDKMQSSTLKRQPSPDWSKADLLRLLSYFEGELQARDITIATLKAEKAKQLLYQAKYGRFGLGDPFVALQRDAEGKNDTGFDEAAIKSMYDNQLAQLENLIATQRKAQLKMREQLGNSEKRFHKVCTELEEEKQKHAQDTAQGDDVTYMLEKERERLKAEIDFEKSQNKKLEKDLKKTLASLEEERSNAARHKQVAIMLIKERKNLIERIVAENHLRDEMETALTDEKSKIQNMAEGLAQESKKALKMEAVIEKQSTKFDTERETLCMRLQKEETQTNVLKAEVARLSKQLESLQHHVRSNDSSPTSMKVRSSVSPARTANPSLPGTSGATGGVVQPSSGSALQSVSPSLNNNSPQAYSPVSSASTVASGVRPASGQHQAQSGTSRTYAQSSHRVTDGGRIGSNSPEREVIYRPENTSTGIMTQRGSNLGVIRPGLSSTTRVDYVDSDMGSGARATSSASEPTATATSHGRGKIVPHVTVPSQIRKSPGIGSTSGSPLGRGTPPPIPPNKPNYVTPGPSSCKPSPPKKVPIVQAAGKDLYSGQYSQTPSKGPSQQAQHMVQIPVNAVGNSLSSGSSLPGQGDAVASVHTQVRETSPSAVKKTSQCVVDSTSLEHFFATHAVVTPAADSSHALEFLGPEMANLQHLLATMSTDEVSQDCIPVANGNTPSALQSSLLSSSLTTTSSQMPLSKLISSPNLQATAHNMPAGEQNNNKVSRSNLEIKSTTKATAQVSPFATRSQTTTLRIFDEHQATTPSVFTSPHIVSPTVVNPPSLTLTPSPKISPTNQSSLINFPTSSPSPTISPAVKRKNIPSRPRSKSPLKTSHNHSRSYSASAARMSTDIHTPVTTQPHSTRWFLSASPIPSLHLSPATEVHGSPLHHNSALGKAEALSKMLTDGKADANLALKDGTTPLHCAAENNQEAIIKILLQNGAKPSSLRDDQVTPLHIAALRGYTSCVRLLLSKGAAVNLSTAAAQTPLHLAVNAGHTECCRLLLRHGANILFTDQDGLTSLHYAVQNNHPEMLKTLLDKLRFTGISRESDTAHQIVAVTDKDGWTITHMAAHLPQKECLLMLAENLPLDFEVKDKLGRSVKAVASAICKELLVGVDQPQNSATVKVMVELRNIHENTTVSNVQLGTMEIGQGLSWIMMEDLLQGTLKGYLSQLNIGLRTRRITRLDADLDRVEKDFTLGLTMANIKHFEIGFYKWTPGMQTNTSPFIMLSKCELKKVTITVNDYDNMCELIAFDVLHPVSNISNYLRLLEQYKSVIFYGPAGSGKSYLAHRLAQSIAARELSLGRKPAIYQLNLQSGYSYANFLAYLKQRNCVVSISRTNENFAPILLLDNLEMVDIAQLFGELLDPMEYRGIAHTFSLRGEGQGRSGMHYLADQFYVIGTMNKSRSLGVDLSILPRFRWVQFRLDTEPLRGLLARHFFRRIFNTYHGCMPSPEDPVFRAIEWIVCVWQRLNDSLNKLGIPEVIQGPCMFFKCPLEKQDHKLILQWMQNTWNQQIAPRVREAVKRGTGSEAPSDGQQKVANTALYVLMQRSVILSCPLSGQDKDVYFAGFSGSNELDIPLKSGEGKPRGTSSAVFSSSSPRNTNQQRRPNSLESAAVQSQKWTSEGESCNSSVLSSSASDFKMRNRNGKESHSGSAVVALNIKRRSLSDSSVNKAAQQEQQQQYLDGIQASSQAKMAKLEVKYPKIVNIASAFRSPSLSSSETSPSGVALKKTGCVSPLLNLVVDNSHISPKKSRSSENISSSGLYGASGRLRSPGPFPFSLTTPTSSLSFFKFLDKSSSEGGMCISEPMPDFSVFEKVPTPTDDIPLNRSFVFVERPELKGKTLRDPTGEEKEKEEVWSMRNDLFQPIYKSREGRGGLESET